MTRATNPQIIRIRKWQRENPAAAAAARARCDAEDAARAAAAAAQRGEPLDEQRRRDV